MFEDICRDNCIELFPRVGNGCPDITHEVWREIWIYIHCCILINERFENSLDTAFTRPNFENCFWFQSRKFLEDKKIAVPIDDIKFCEEFFLAEFKLPIVALWVMYHFGCASMLYSMIIFAPLF